VTEAIRTVDTTALFKWRVGTATSDTVCTRIDAEPTPTRSRLAWHEYRCASMRRVFCGAQPSTPPSRAQRKVTEDAQNGGRTLVPLRDEPALWADDLRSRIEFSLHPLSALYPAAETRATSMHLANANRVPAFQAESLNSSASLSGTPS